MMNQGEMLVSTLCGKCPHRKVCKNIDTMNKARETIGDQFFISTMASASTPFPATNKYELIDAMKKAGISVELVCENHSEEY
jgi:predicted metal-binding protein